MIEKLFYNPYTGFLVVATGITITILLLRLLLKFRVLLWKSTLISYIVFAAFATFMYVDSIRGHGLSPFWYTVFKILGPLLLVPGMLIYGLIPGVIKPCPSDTDVLGWLTFGFLFYAVVIWGIMKIIKQRKETKAAVKK